MNANVILGLMELFTYWACLYWVGTVNFLKLISGLFFPEEF